MIRILLLLSFAFFATGRPALCDVRIFDAVTTPGQAVFLQVQTRGRLLAEGGGRVALTIGDAPARTILTGGDGNGFLKFLPDRPGKIPISAAYGDESAKANLLVLDKGEKIVAVEMETMVRLNTLFDPDHRKKARKGLETVARLFQLVYMAGPLSFFTGPSWQGLARLPRGPVLKYRGKETFRSLAARKVAVRAVIGSAAFAAAATGCAEKRLSFDQVPGDHIRIKTWKEIPGHLE